jgi:hypothetical protein
MSWIPRLCSGFFQLKTTFLQSGAVHFRDPRAIKKGVSAATPCQRLEGPAVPIDVGCAEHRVGLELHGIELFQQGPDAQGQQNHPLACRVRQFQSLKTRLQLACEWR